jgi:tight adherence protein C
METALLFMAALTAFCIAAVLFAPVVLRPSPEMRRILVVAATERTDKRRIGQRELVEQNLLSLSRGLRERLGIRLSAQVQQRLALAGIRSPQAPDLFFAAQCLTPLVGAFAGSFFKDNILFWVFALCAAGYVAPNFWLTEKVRRRKDRIRRSLPDAIDLLVICVDAGLGMDQALLRVIAELSLSHPDLQDELQRVHLEQRAGLPRLDAWRNLANRLKIPEISAFVNMLTQTERFGTPIVRALTRFASDMRLKRRQLAEEAAAKTKVKILFPLVFCIFPCLFIVLLAPAIISISRTLGSVGK